MDLRKNFFAAGAGALLLIVALVLPVRVAQAGITGSAHDFSGDVWSGGKICQPCHTPHNADTSVAEAPLWNHEITTATFVLYSSPTLNASPSQPGGSSKLCLSCHDGTVAIDSFGGATGTNIISGSANVGTNLSNDHPTSFTYDAALAGADGELVDPSADGDADPDTVGNAVPYVPLFSGQLQCASCHDVHNSTSLPQLLRVSNAGSGLCLKCHTK
jgi:predicted CXXCH cytochrome family protein